MKEFKVLFVPCLIAVTCLALLAQEPQGRGGQVPPAPEGAAGARGGQVPPVADGAAGARGGQRGGRGGGGAAGGGAAGGGGGNAAAGGRGGGGGKNIQVLVGADIPSTMQGFVQSLGL